jgi:hypothetical protein
MTKSTRVLIIGAAVGGIITGIGSWRIRQLETQLERLQAACVSDSEMDVKQQIAESEREALVPGSSAAIAKELGGTLEPVRKSCDAALLATNNEVHEGLQADLANIQREVWKWQGSQQWSASS